ncbi:MAG: GEVED domain-containing protein [Flavobacteriaceae bacterium]
MKNKILLFLLMIASSQIWGQTGTITITQTSADITQSSYDNGTERTWTQDEVDFGAKAVLKQGGQARIQVQADNGVFYNTSPLPGRIVNVIINYNGTARTYSFHGGNSSRLVNNTTGNYDVTGGTQVGDVSSTGWGSALFESTDYTYFAIKRKSTGASYINSIIIEYEVAPTCSAPDTPNGSISGTTPACVSTILTYTHGSGQPQAGIAYYWQTESTGTNTDNNASSTLNVTSSGTYYIRAYDSVEDCWSMATSGYAVEVNTFVAPSVTTHPDSASSITATSATLRASASTFGYCPDTTIKGFVYAITSASSIPEIGGTGVTNVPIALGSQGAFSQNITDLTEGTIYSYRAYLYDGVTYTYGNVQEFTTGFSGNLNNVTATKACLTNNGGIISWNAPATGTTPTGYLVFGIEGATSPSNFPSPYFDIADYDNFNSDFSAVTNGALPNPANLGKILYRGNATSVNITGLTEGQNYSFLVLAYQQGSTVSRASSGAATAMALDVIADDDVKTFTGTTSNEQVTLNWTYNGNTSLTSCFNEVIIVANEGTVNFTPSGDGSTYTANATYTTPNQIVYKGTGNTVAVSGLANQTEYCFKIFVRRGTVWSDGTDFCAIPTVAYCSSTGNSNNSGILNVSFNTINQGSTSTSGYTDYINVNTTLVLGHSYDLEVVVNTNGNYTSYVKVWIDWNINGTFDSSEAYELGSVTNNSNGTPSLSPYVIHVPTTATPGSLRMRIAANTDNNLNGYSTPCQNFTYGEVEDYTIIVAQPTETEINIKGNNISIPDGFDQPYALNNTLFSQTDIGNESATKEFTIENIGLTTLNLTGSPLVEITGTDPNDFVVSQQPASNTVESGSSVSFQIKFAPTSTGIRTATISISNDDSDENPYTFDVQGTGVCSYTPEIAANPDTGPAGTVVSFTSVVEDFTGATATYNGVSITPISITSSQVDVQIPLEANDGNLVLYLANGCTYNHSFNLINTAVSDCDSEEGGGSTFAPNLTFFEFYDRKDGSYGYVSIYNGTENDVNLSGYSIHRAPDYEGTYSTYANLSGTLPAGEIAIIGVNTGGNCPYSSTGNGSFGSSGFNENDGFRLMQGSTIIDDFHAPDYTGYYVRRKTEYLFSPNNVYDEIEWTTQQLDTGQCLDNVAEAPIIKTPPLILNETFVYTSCDSASLKVTASEGTDAGAGLTYQWYMNNGTDNTWTALSNSGVYNGVTTAHLTISSLASISEHQYYVRVMEGGTECYAASSAWQVRLSDLSTAWNGTEWSNNPPDHTKKVVISGAYNTNTDGGFEACLCEVTSTGNLIIEEGEDVVIHNELLNAGTVLVKNNANLIQINDVTNTGNINVERITRPMNRYSYTYWGSPVQTNVSNIGWWAESVAESGNFDVNASTLVTQIFAWNTTAQTWATAGATIPGDGFIAKAPNNFPTGVNDRKQVQTVFQGVAYNGDIERIIIANDDEEADSYTDAKMTFLSNPYPSAINIDKLLLEYGTGISGGSGTQVVPTIYLWTHASNPTDGAYSSSDFATYTLLGGTATELEFDNESPISLTPEGKIASGQGFFIKGTTAGGTVTFKNEYRYNTANTEGYDNSQFFKVANNEQLFERHRFWLNLTGSDARFKQTLIGYSDIASDGVDGLDGAHYEGGNPTNLYTILDNHPFVVQAYSLPFENTDMIPLGYKVGTSGTYEITLGNFDGLFESQDIYLKDNLTGVRHNLKESAYEFSSAAGNFTDRFEVVFRPYECVVYTVWNGTEWSNGEPDIAKRAIIEGNLTITEDMTACEVYVHSGVIVINSGATLTVRGEIINIQEANNFVVQNNANLIQIENISNTGNIKVYRNSSLIKHLDYTSWSSPVTGQGLRAFSPETLWYRIYDYNTTTDQWVQVFGASTDEDEDFQKGIGYMLRAPNNFITTPYTYNGLFEGVPNNGDIKVAFNQLGVYQGVGNPYPSNISITDFWTQNPDTGTLYFWTNTNPWNPALGDYGDYTANNWATYNEVGAVSAANDTKLPNAFISVGQGFVTQTTTTLSEVVFTNSMRTSNEGVFFKTMEEDKHKFWLNLSNQNQILNQALVGYIGGATNGKDFGIDAVLFGYSGSALYSLIDSNEENYVIQGRVLPFDDNDVVPIGLRINEAGSFTISLADFDGIFEEGQDIYLRDNLTQIEQNLKEGDYSFVSDQGIFNNRFEVVYKQSGTLSITPNLDHNWLVYNKENFIILEALGFEMKDIYVYDMLGREVYSYENINSNHHSIKTINSNQVLIIKMVGQDGTVSVKKVQN